MSGRERILLVEDDDDMRTACRKYLESAKFEVLEASSPRGAEAVMLRENVQLILTDLRMPGGGGEAVVKLGHSILREVPIVIITAYPSVKSAIDSFKSGVVDYLIKPFTGEQLLECVERVLAEKRARDGFQALLPPSAGDPAESEIVGSSAPLREVLAEIRRVAAATGPVLITGEKGLLKARIARSIHGHSRRAGGPFIIASCALLPPDLLVADLFGYENHAFPGQPASRSGLVEEADHGTLFLDEVGDLSLESQALVLRLMEEEAVRRLGAAGKRNVDLRILASTSKDLPRRSGRRISGSDLISASPSWKCIVPPSRAERGHPGHRGEDPDRLNSAAAGRALNGFTEEALLAIKDYGWPGNIRDLQCALQRAHTTSAGPLITLQDLVQSEAFQAGGKKAWSPADGDATLARLERQHLVEALARHAGNVTKASEALGIHRTTLQRLMKRYGLERT